MKRLVLMGCTLVIMMMSFNGEIWAVPTPQDAQNSVTQKIKTFDAEHKKEMNLFHQQNPLPKHKGPLTKEERLRKNDIRVQELQKKLEYERARRKLLMQLLK